MINGQLIVPHEANWFFNEVSKIPKNYSIKRPNLEYILEIMGITKETINKFLGPETDKEQKINLKIFIGVEKVYIGEVWSSHNCQKDGSCGDHLLIINKKEKFLDFFKIKA